MIYAIIAAGEGSRLLQEGVKGPKPMVRVNGEMLIDRLLRIFMNNRAEKIVVIVNDHSRELVEHLQGLNLAVPLQLVIKSTPSSFHSFYELLQADNDIEELCLATTDSIFDESEFSLYIDEFENGSQSDGLFAVTSFIDDETPLYVSFDDSRAIIEISDNSVIPNPFISGGIYCLGKSALAVVTTAMNKGVHRMRNFQKMLLQQGLRIEAFPFSKVLDIDHVTDIAKAEQFLIETGKTNNLAHVNG